MTPKREVYVLVAKEMPEDSDYEQSYAGLLPESGRKSVVTARRPSWKTRLASWFGLDTGQREFDDFGAADDFGAEDNSDDDWGLSQEDSAVREHPSRPAA